MHFRLVFYLMISLLLSMCGCDETANDGGGDAREALHRPNEDIETHPGASIRDDLPTVDFHNLIGRFRSRLRWNPRRLS